VPEPTAAIPVNSSAPTRYDLFLSHASEDKETIARPLYMALTNAGMSVWFDEAVLRLGDSLSGKIDEGLAKCAHGIIIISPSFLDKKWTQRELAGLVAREVAGGTTKLLPIWHDIDHATLVQHSPTLADRVAGKSTDGISKLVKKIKEAVTVVEIIGEEPRRTRSAKGSKGSFNAEERRLVLGGGMNIQLSRSANEVVSAFAIPVRNSYIRRQNTIHNIHAQITFTHFDIETFEVEGLFIQSQQSTDLDPRPESAASLRHGDMRHLLLLASRQKIPMMAADHSAFYTITAWPFETAREKHLYDVEWTVKLELTCDSPEETISTEFILRIFPQPQGGFSFGQKPAS